MRKRRFLQATSLYRLEHEVGNDDFPRIAAQRWPVLRLAIAAQARHQRGHRRRHAEAARLTRIRLRQAPDGAAIVIDGPQSVVWDEAENRMHVQKALMEFLLLGRIG